MATIFWTSISDGIAYSVSDANPFPVQLISTPAGANFDTQGNLLVNQGGLTLAADNPGASFANPYFAQLTYTALNGTDTTATFSFNLGVGTLAVQAISHIYGQLTVSNSLTVDVTGMTIKLQDTIGPTTAQGDTYNVFNVASANIASSTLPTFLISHNTTGRWSVPIDHGVYRTAVVTLTFSGAVTQGGTVNIQFATTGINMPIDPAYFVFGNLTAQTVVTNATLASSPGANNRWYLLEALITNTSAAAGTAKIVNNDTNKTPFGGEGQVAAPGGFHIGPYDPHGGIAASAQAQAINLTTTGASSVMDAWVALRMGH